jgi:hypothetical protein
MRQNQQIAVVLTEAQRLRRVAELLCKAIVLAEVKRVVEPVHVADGDDNPGHCSARPNDTGSEEIRILDYLELRGRGSPVSIREALGLSRSATYRALHRLTVAGHVIPSGQTRMLAYQLNKAEPCPQKIGLN